MTNNNSSATSFAHIADVHLGHIQYNLDQRKKDMLDSFRDAVDRIIKRRVDFVLLAGDLFHSRDVSAKTLEDAQVQLERLNKEGIEVIAVEGNHDARLYRRELSWMEYLHRQGLLTLLAADFNDEEVFHPPSINREVSGYVNCGDVRVFGVQYLGQRFSERLPDIITGIKKTNVDDSKPTILLTHLGISGQVPGAPGASLRKVKELEDCVDYIALGHFHKRFEKGLIQNPGSLEAHDRRQAEWDQGMYFVDVTSDGDVLSRYEKSKRRPYFSLLFDLSDSFTMEDAKSQFEKELEKEELNFLQSPIVSLVLRGKLSFSRDVLDLNWLRRKVEEKYDALHVILSDATELKTVPSFVEELEKDKQGRIDRNKLELLVFRHLTAKDSRYGMKEEGVAKTIFMTKDMILSGEDPASVVKELKTRRRKMFRADSEESQSTIPNRRTSAAGD